MTMIFFFFYSSYYLFFKGKIAKRSKAANQTQLWIFHFCEHMPTRDHCVTSYHVFTGTLKACLRSSKLGSFDGSAANMPVFRAACNGHINMDKLNVSYTVYLIKTSGLNVLSYFLHWKWFSASLSGMVWFLFMVAAFFLFSETEATVAEASKTISQSEFDVSGQHPSWSPLGPATAQNIY